MDYVSLKKSFYSDPTSERFEHAQALHMTRLMSESTFRTGVIVGDDELFLAVPRELSLLNDRVLRHEHVIATHMQMLPPVAQWALVRGLVVDEVVSTNDLEGVYSTRRQINELLQRSPTDTDPVGQKRFRELARLYLDLYGNAPERPSTVEDIRSIYDRVMSGEPLDERHKPDGKVFRRDGVEIYAPNGKMVHKGIEPERRIIEMVEDMIAIVNSEDIPKTYSAIMGHFIFEYTHPFYDGNGRTGRYLLALHLSGPLSIPTSLSLSRVLAENRGAYYKSFREAEHPLNHGELTLFVMNILENVSVAQDELDEELARKMEQHQGALDRLQEFQDSHGLSDKETQAVYFLTLMQLFAAFPDSTLTELADHMELSTQQARVHAKRLESKGVIVATNKRPLRFVLSDEAISQLGVERSQSVGR